MVMDKNTPVNFFQKILVKEGACKDNTIPVEQLLKHLSEAPRVVHEFLESSQQIRWLKYFKMYPDIFIVVNNCKIGLHENSPAWKAVWVAIEFFKSKLKVLHASKNKPVSFAHLLEIYHHCQDQLVVDAMENYYGGQFLRLFLNNNDVFCVTENAGVYLTEQAKNSQEDFVITYFVKRFKRLGASKAPIKTKMVKQVYYESGYRIKKLIHKHYGGDIMMFLQTFPDVFIVCDDSVGLCQNKANHIQVSIRNEANDDSEIPSLLAPFIGTSLSAPKHVETEDEKTVLVYFRRHLQLLRAFFPPLAVPLVTLEKITNQNSAFVSRYIESNYPEDFIAFFMNHHSDFRIFEGKSVYLAWHSKELVEKYILESFREKLSKSKDFPDALLHVVCKEAQDFIVKEYGNVFKFLELHSDTFHLSSEGKVELLCKYRKENSNDLLLLSANYFKNVLSETEANNTLSPSLTYLKLSVQSAPSPIKHFLNREFPGSDLMEYFCMFPDYFVVTSQECVSLVKGINHNFCGSSTKTSICDSKSSTPLLWNSESDQQCADENDFVSSESTPCSIGDEKQIITYMKKLLKKNFASGIDLDHLISEVNRNVCALTSFEILNLALDHQDIFVIKDGKIYFNSQETSEELFPLVSENKCVVDV